MSILIIGSGFSGLVSAITFRKIGIPSTIFEANSNHTDIGGSITMFPNSMKILRSLGVADTVIDNGITITNAKFQDTSGSHLVNRSMGTSLVYGEPTVTIRRSLLNKILHQEAIDLGIQVVFNKKVETISDTNDGVIVGFHDQTEVFGSLVIGCDGINSITRKYVLRKTVDPVYSNLLYLAGFVENQEFIKSLNLDPQTQYITIGPESFFAYSYIDNSNKPNPSLLWYCYVPQPERLRQSQLNSVDKEFIERSVLDLQKGWHDPIDDMILNSTSYCKSSVSDIVEIERWSRDRVIVIGDAAHSMNPISGQGACTAIEDGYVLAKLLSKHKMDHTLVFTIFEKHRKHRISKIAKKARKSSRRTTIKFNRILETIRNYAFSLLTALTPESHLNRTFTYDADKEIEAMERK